MYLMRLASQIFLTVSKKKRKSMAALEIMLTHLKTTTTLAAVLFHYDKHIYSQAGITAPGISVSESTVFFRLKYLRMN